MKLNPTSKALNPRAFFFHSYKISLILPLKVGEYMGLEIINQLKKERGLTNEELSAKSGVPLGTLSKITSGITKDPKLETLKAIAKVLNCSLDDFDDETNSSLLINQDEIHLIEQYRQLNLHGKQLVNAVIAFELSQSPKE